MRNIKNFATLLAGLGSRNRLFFVKGGVGVVVFKILGVGVVKKFFRLLKITDLDFYLKVTLKKFDIYSTIF